MRNNGHRTRWPDTLLNNFLIHQLNCHRGDSHGLRQKVKVDHCCKMLMFVTLYMMCLMLSCLVIIMADLIYARLLLLLCREQQQQRLS
jgi:hypothetical protein